MKKNQSGFSAVELVIGLVFVGALVGVGVVFAKRHNDAPKTNTSSAPEQQKSKPSDQLKPETVIKKIKETLAQTYTFVDLDANSQPQKGQLAIRVDDSTPLYKSQGYKYYTDSDGGSGIGMLAGPANRPNEQLPYKDDVTIRNQVSSIYKEFGLTKSGKRTSIGVETYEGKGLICDIDAADEPSSPTTARCGVISNYKVMAAKLQPFAKVMNNVEDDTVLANLRIHDSRTKGYQWAEIGQGGYSDIGGSSARLYRKTTGEWQYLANSQMQIECSAYNTPDRKAAFLGEPCLDESNDSAVVQ